jgi:RNA polymerase sigma factor (TIGR02999 family)
MELPGVGSGSTGEIAYRQNGGDCVLLSKGMSEITLVLQAVGRGENRASEELLPLVYDELRQLAAARMAHESAGQTLQPTALVHEAWLRLVTEGDRTWQNRAHFFRAAAQAMRRILVDRARHKSSIKCGGGQDRLDIEDLDLAAATPDDKILLIDDALARLEAEDPESARVITLKFFGGLTNKEAAKTLGVTERTVEREWAYAKACLYQMIQEEI